ncbi:unnamed protein product, partial [Amoebophrya sp. A25]
YLPSGTWWTSTTPTWSPMPNGNYMAVPEPEAVLGPAHVAARTSPSSSSWMMQPETSMHQSGVAQAPLQQPPSPSQHSSSSQSFPIPQSSSRGHLITQHGGGAYNLLSQGQASQGGPSSSMGTARSSQGMPPPKVDPASGSMGARSSQQHQEQPPRDHKPQHWKDAPEPNKASGSSGKSDVPPSGGQDYASSLMSSQMTLARELAILQ